MKQLIPIFALLLLSAPAWAQSCTTASCTAASCSEANVLAALPSSGNSNATVTVNIPACSATTWTTGFSYTLPSAVTNLTISGAGTPNTGSSTFGAGTITSTIVDNGGYTNGLMFFTLGYGQTLTLENLNLQPLASNTQLITPIYVIGTCTSSGCPNFRGDNLTFSGFSENGSGYPDGNGSPANWDIRLDNVYGVLDHNTTLAPSNVQPSLLGNVNHSAWLGVGNNGDNSWAQPDSYGTASAFFFENNSFPDGGSMQDCDIADIDSDVGGCRIVVRYNHLTASFGESLGYFHGTDTDGRPRGGRQAEIYNNTSTCTASGGCSSGITTYRSGTGYAFGNTMTASTGFWGNMISLDAFRTVYTNTPFGACGGSGAYDTNDGTVYYSGTVSSPSTSGGQATMTDSSKSWATNQFVPSGAPYSVHDVTQGWWAEIASNTATTLTTQPQISEQSNAFTSGDSYQILRASVCLDQPARSGGTYLSGSTPTPTGANGQTLDPLYEWNDTVTGSWFHGTFGSDTGKLIEGRDFYTGCSVQTSPTSPFNGTDSGSCGTGFGTTANRPTSCTAQVGYWATDTNTLYLCKTANTWTASYTPYTYPHPLTVPVPPPPPASTGLRCVVVL